MLLSSDYELPVSAVIYGCSFCSSIPCQGGDCVFNKFHTHPSRLGFVPSTSVNTETGVKQSRRYHCGLHMLSCARLLVTCGLRPARLFCLWGSPGKNIGVGCMSSSRGSSWPMDRIWVSCVSFIGRQILYHCVTWLIPEFLLINCFLGGTWKIRSATLNKTRFQYLSQMNTWVFWLGIWKWQICGMWAVVITSLPPAWSWANQPWNPFSLGTPGSSCKSPNVSMWLETHLPSLINVNNKF